MSGQNRSAPTLTDKIKSLAFNLSFLPINMGLYGMMAYYLYAPTLFLASHFLTFTLPLIILSSLGALVIVQILNSFSRKKILHDRMAFFLLILDFLNSIIFL